MEMSFDPKSLAPASTRNPKIAIAVKRHYQPSPTHQLFAHKLKEGFGSTLKLHQGAKKSKRHCQLL